MDIDFWAKIATFICIIGFPVIRVVKKRVISRNEAIKFMLLGASIPPGAFLVLSFFDRSFLSIVTDQPSYMLVMGMIIVFYGIGDLLDWDT
jgi:hypothetical protein